MIRHGTSSHVDVLIIGAGLSGINAAYRMQTECRSSTYVILEARQRIGGTWDLFRYPGVRSDSDMSTLGFPFRPWRGEEAMAGGDAIRTYIQDTAEAYGIDQHIRFGHRVVDSAWSSRDALWRVTAEVDGERVEFTCGFMLGCGGYYSYDQGHLPDFPEVGRYQGLMIHPQFWPQDLDVAGKRIVVIGSGATAVTLIPSLARTAAHVTMLQRSPTYIMARPAKDPLDRRIRGWLPGRLADTAIRWKNIVLGIQVYRSARRNPDRVRGLLKDHARAMLRPGIDVDRHFTPTYAPWDQRLCVVPDADLFVALNQGRASIVTDHIEGFTETGIRLRSGETLEADIVVTATGLVMNVGGGATMSIDGEPATLSNRMVYKGMMADGVPNLAFAFGYTNASWTLKSDLTARYVCRLVNFMKRRRYAVCVPRQNDPTITMEPMAGLESGYVQRARGILPQQGSRSPWKVHQNYIRDLLMIRFGRIADGVMEFRRAPSTRDV